MHVVLRGNGSLDLTEGVIGGDSGSSVFVGQYIFPRKKQKNKTHPRHPSACKMNTSTFLPGHSPPSLLRTTTGVEGWGGRGGGRFSRTVNRGSARLSPPCSPRWPVQFLIECRGKNKSSFLPLRRRTQALTSSSPLLSLLSPLPVSSLRTLTVTDAYWMQPYLPLLLSSLLFSPPSFLSYSLVNKEKIRAGEKIYFFFFFFPLRRQGERLHTGSDLLSVLVIILHAFYLVIVFRYNSLL